MRCLVGGGRDNVRAGDPIRGVGGIVLAAGGGHAGGPCRLHVVDREAWVLRAAGAALDAGLWPVVAVVGENADDVRGALAGLPVATVADEGFGRGLGGSIRLGLRRVTECAPAARGVVLLGCEPPAVEARQLQALAAAVGARPGAAAASVRAGALGLPAYFPAAAFALLAAMADAEGCAELLRRHAPGVVAVEAR